MGKFRQWIIAAAAVAILSTPVLISERAEASSSGVFNTHEIRRTNLKPFTKWRDALKRFERESAKAPGRCGDLTQNKCRFREWAALIEKLRGLSPAEQMRRVNRFMNRSRYIIDPINWGVKDYWESPGQFFTREGDCEDYAITKYMTLKRLGFDPRKMRIVVLRDLNLKIAHAVLAVEMNGKRWILDNQIEQVVEDTTIRHYLPLYSINEYAWWLHRREG